jgi:hypothetical protein
LPRTRFLLPALSSLLAATSNEGARITSAEAVENPTHAQWRQRDSKRYRQVMKTNRVPHSYSELQQQIHQDLRIQHPNWIEPNGDCPTCDSYESRLAELLGLNQHSTAMPTLESSAMSHAAAA